MKTFSVYPLSALTQLCTQGWIKHDGPQKMAGLEDRAAKLIELERPQRTSRILPKRETERPREGNDSKLM